jgi:SpoVK/Ycf46/Vps4 family AAA+-type ATPase
LFLLAGENMDRRLAAMALFDPDSPLQARRLLDEPREGSERGPWTPLEVGPAWAARLTTGRAAVPSFGADFPAKEIVTAYKWEDLVLPEDAREELENLVAWVEHEPRLLGEWGLRRHLTPGYRVLFHGPPGTGKTVTAAVLGARLKRPVYRVDLSRVVSKWIGETEKNLALLFDQAADRRMILFFDEADALFGKRGDGRSANDRHSNQQIAYLLQRIEDSPGVVILASNLRSNIDDAFARRFQSMIPFRMPDPAARLELWKRVLAAPGLPAGGIEPADLASRFELSGGGIVNALRHAATQAAAGARPLSLADLEIAAEREVRKERYGGA